MEIIRYWKRQLIFESSNAGNYNINVPVTGKYEITIIGAGGGGSSCGDQPKYSWKSSSAGGGAGAYIYAEMQLNAGNYNAQVGTGGNRALSGDWGEATAENGTDSKFSNLITAEGGKGGYTKWTDGEPIFRAGEGGQYQFSSSVNIKNTYIGNQGTIATGYNQAYGGSSKLGSYGKGGDAQATGSHAGNVYNGNSGYVKIERIYEVSKNDNYDFITVINTGRTLFAGRNAISRVFHARNEIQAIYKGNELVWGIYYPGQIIIEQGFAISSSVFLEMNGEYEITLVAGGGGGSNNFGGAGAGIKLRVYLNRGTYNYTVGAGGRGAGAYVRNNDGVSGNPSYFSGANISITCNGGIRRRGRRNGSSGGETGTLGYNISTSHSVLARTTDNNYSAFGIMGENYNAYGSGGQPQGNDEGAGYAGQVGYIKIQKL